MADGERQGGTERKEQTCVRHNWALIGIFLILGTGALVMARALLMPVIFAFLLAITFAPVRRILSAARIPAGVAAAIIVLVLILGLAAAIVGLSGPVRNYVANAPDLIAEAERKLTTLSSTVRSVAEAGDEMAKLTPQEADDAQPVVVRQPGPFARLATTAPVLVGQMVLTLALLFFILASGDMFYEKTVHAIPTFGDKRRAVQIFRDIEVKLSRYFLTITFINAGLGAVIGIVMGLAGLPNPILLGVMAFIFNFVPYIGAVGGIGVVFILGLLTFETIAPAFMLGGIYLLLTFLEGQFITPTAVGKRLKLNTVMVFLAVAFWGWAWSIIGMVIAMPMLIALRAFSEHIPAMRPLGVFLSARHAELDEPGDSRSFNGRP